MSFQLKNNAYHILGLDTTANEKVIHKRSKEIINRLKVDDTPDYDLDIGLFENFRTDELVKDALQRLQAPKKRIREYFFWFQIVDDVDEQVLGLFKQRDYLNAIRTWENVSQGKTTKAFFYKKNLAILYCLVLSTEDNIDYLRSSLVAWKKLINSDKFWKSFSKVYKLHDEQTASQDIISDFKNNVTKYLSNIYTELHHIHKNNDYIKEFQKVFSVKGEEIKSSVLGPAYQSLNQTVENLEKMNVSEDSVFDKAESEEIRQHIAKIQQELNKLIDLGLYDDSQTKIMRDRSANALRSIILDLHNNLSELDKARGLMAVAIQFAGTESMKNKLKAEFEQIEKSIKDDTENSLVIEIPGKIKGGTMVIKNTFLEFKGKQIFYKDVDNTSFSSTAQTTTVVGLPLSTTYSYNWQITITKENRISLSFSSNSDKGEKKEAWTQLVGITVNLIVPHIVKRMVDQIFDRGEIVKIGNVEFTKQGYSKMKYKMFGKNKELIVYWTDKLLVPQFDSGMVIIWEDKNEENEQQKQFATIAMSTPNAVVIPDLIQACSDRANLKI